MHYFQIFIFLWFGITSLEYIQKISFSCVSALCFIEKQRIDSGFFVFEADKKMKDKKIKSEQFVKKTTEGCGIIW